MFYNYVDEEANKISEEDVRLSNFKVTLLFCMSTMRMSLDFMRECVGNAEREQIKDLEQYLVLRTSLLKDKKKRIFDFKTALDNDNINFNIVTYIKNITQNDYLKQNLELFVNKREEC